MARNIKIENPDALKALNKKYKWSEKAQKALQKLQKAQENFNEYKGKTQRADERARPILIEEKDKLNLDEYEEVSRVYRDNGQWYFEISDRMEEFKQNWKEQKEQEKEEQEKILEEAKNEEWEEDSVTVFDYLLDKVKGFFGLNENTDNQSQPE